eukprot:GHVR01141998.1.p1 GENE.GHVR01141998.1~~GHVR01141998.1.p1  ORF type:complete len:219 (+),score=44.12 GHVR01141998.1:87-743(+)
MTLHMTLYTTSVVCICLISVLIKILLIPSYRSTDFEVHRNWLALTHTLPVSQWYTDTTSEWTLDYPPVFAYFERLLALPASVIDPNMTHVSNINYSSSATIYFQRLSVIATEAILYYATLKLSHVLSLINKDKDVGGWGPYGRSLASLSSVTFSAQILLVDNIHFQYNGMLIGTLMLSMAYFIQGRITRGCVLFTFLVCAKHIFVYVVYVCVCVCISE